MEQMTMAGQPFSTHSEDTLTIRSGNVRQGKVILPFARKGLWWEHQSRSKTRQSIYQHTQRGHGLFFSESPRRQRVLIKTTVVKNRGVSSRGRRGKATSWFKHGAYLQRDGAQGSGRGLGFSAECQDISLSTTLARWQREGDRHMIKLIVSPEHGNHLNLPQFGWELMAAIEHDLHTPVEWVGIDHYNTQHPHLHLVIRGKDRDGKPLYINRDYLRNSVRERARELATQSLGMRLQPEINQSRDRAVSRDVWTELDRQLQRRLTDDRQLPVKEDEPLSPHELRRLEALRQRGLAWNDDNQTWQLTRAWQWMSEQGETPPRQHDRERVPEHERTPAPQSPHEQERERERREDEQERQRRLTQIIDLENDLG